MLSCGPPPESRNVPRRLEELGLVDRRTDPSDGRGTLITVKPAGSRLSDRLSAHYLEEERAVIASLDPDEQTALGDMLKRILLGVEGPRGDPAPAHKRAVGLALAVDDLNARVRLGQLDELPVQVSSA